MSKQATNDVLIADAGMAGRPAPRTPPAPAWTPPWSTGDPSPGALPARGEGDPLVFSDEPGPELDSALLSIHPWAAIAADASLAAAFAFEPEGGIATASSATSLSALEACARPVTLPPH